MKYQIAYSTQILYGPNAFCSIKAAQKALGIKKPNNTDCIIRIKHDLYHIVRIYEDYEGPIEWPYID